MMIGVKGFIKLVFVRSCYHTIWIVCKKKHPTVFVLLLIPLGSHGQTDFSDFKLLYFNCIFWGFKVVQQELSKFTSPVMNTDVQFSLSA